LDFERILRLPPDCRALGSFDAGGLLFAGGVGLLFVAGGLLFWRLRNLFKVLPGVDTLRVFGTLALPEFEGGGTDPALPEFDEGGGTDPALPEFEGGALGPLNTPFKKSILYYPLF
jgi:hypothetical protein